MADDRDLRTVLDWLSERKYASGTCYRCWQVGRDGVPATLVVRYNAGTEHAFTARVCAACAADDASRFHVVVLAN